MEINFWKNKRVFLTGHTGFKGAWLSVWLNYLGSNVYGYSLNPPSSPSLYEVAKINQLIGEKIGNICDYDLLSKEMSAFQPEIVFHLAAQSLVHYSYQNPVETYQSNVMGTVSLLEAVKKVKNIKSVVIVTSDKCYENFEKNIGYEENEPMGGFDPYSSSKGCVELLTSSWRRSYFRKSNTSIATARAGNVIGGGDWSSNRLIPDFMRSFSSGERAYVRNPNSVRPWQFVMEPLYGYLTLAEHLYHHGNSYSEPWNFGPLEKHTYSVEYVANKLKFYWGDNSFWMLDGNEYPHEAKYLSLNINKALKKLPWSPLLDIDESLKLTCDWYKKFYVGNESALSLTEQQIKIYNEKISNYNESKKEVG